MPTHNRPVQNTAIVGLDIGSSKICAAIGQQNEAGKIDILALCSVPNEEGVSAGTVVNISKTAAAIDKALEQISEKSGYDISSVNISVSGSGIVGKHHRSSITRKSNGNEVVAEDITHLAEDIRRTFHIVPGSETLHILPQDFIVNNQRIEYPVGRVGVRLEGDFYIVSGLSGDIENAQSAVERVSAKTMNARDRMEVDKVIFSPLATALATLTNAERREGVALVDIGEDTTEIAIFHNKGLRHIAVIPYGGSNVTNDLREGCRILRPQAEKLKLNFGTAIDEDISSAEVVSVPGIDNRSPRDIALKNAAMIMQHRFQEIAAMVVAEIIRSGYEGQLLGGIVLTGGSANIHGIDQLFEQVSENMHVRIGSSQKNIGTSKFTEINDPEYATVVGLIMAGYMPLDERIEMITSAKMASSQSVPLKNNEDTKKSPFWQKIRGFMTDDLSDRYN